MSGAGEHGHTAPACGVTFGLHANRFTIAGPLLRTWRPLCQHLPTFTVASEEHQAVQGTSPLSFVMSRPRPASPRPPSSPGCHLFPPPLAITRSDWPAGKPVSHPPPSSPSAANPASARCKRTLASAAAGSWRRQPARASLGRPQSERTRLGLRRSDEGGPLPPRLREEAALFAGFLSSSSTAEVAVSQSVRQRRALTESDPQWGEGRQRDWIARAHTDTHAVLSLSDTWRGWGAAPRDSSSAPRPPSPSPSPRPRLLLLPAPGSIAAL